jgi:hypothetical protein
MGVICLSFAGLVACSDESSGNDAPALAATDRDAGPVEMTPKAEETHFKVRIENVAAFTNRKSGVFNTAVGADKAGPLAPGQAYETKFTAGKAHALVFATMFGQSNDWFFGTAPTGVPLFDESGKAVTGDITGQIKLYDAGTEVDEEPAVGAHTGPKQSTSTDGPGANDPNDKVREVPAGTKIGATTVPAVSAMLKATLSFDDASGEFTLRIENVASDTSTLITSEGAKPVRISPGVWALATGTEPIFTLDAKDRGEGLEAIAEMGNPASLGDALPKYEGVATPLSPGVWRLQTSGAAFFAAGEKDRGEGLEAIAEKGDIAMLSGRCASGATDCGSFAIPVGGSKAGPIRPGGAYEFDVVARAGDRITWAQMYGASNDWFFGTSADGIALFGADGKPVTGDLTSEIHLWDAGTEADEELAIGPHVGAPEGPADPMGVVREVGTAYATPVAAHLKVTISVAP